VSKYVRQIQKNDEVLDRIEESGGLVQGIMQRRYMGWSYFEAWGPRVDMAGSTQEGQRIQLLDILVGDGSYVELNLRIWLKREDGMVNNIVQWMDEWKLCKTIGL